MQSSETGLIFYLGTRVKDTRDNAVGTVYGLKILGSDGIRVKFDNGTKKVYFGTYHQYLVKLPGEV